MGSEAIVQGKIRAYLAPVDTARAAAPNLAPPVAFVLIGESFFNDDGISLSSSKTREFQQINNEPLPVKSFVNAHALMATMNLMNFTAELLAIAFNSNAVTTEAPSATDAGFLEVSLEVPTTDKEFALLIVYEASAYDAAGVRTAGFNSDFYYPRVVEMGDFESVLSAKAPAMVPLSFQALKSDTAANAAARMVNLATT